jgi:CheY-like chemotaxis protein
VASAGDRSRALLAQAQVGADSRRQRSLPTPSRTIATTSRRRQRPAHRGGRPALRDPPRDRSREGVQGRCAEHGEEALAAIRRYKPRAITLDIKLPGIHGLALLDRLKNQPKTRHIPVQIVSVSDELPRRKRKGAISQLKKPVTRENVVAQLERMKAIAERPVKRLLVVEDNEVQRRLVEEFIGGDDVVMTGVARGADALTALSTGEFDAALVDLGLPDMTGFELIDKIRDDLGLSDLPIIVHTGRELTPRRPSGSTSAPRPSW